MKVSVVNVQPGLRRFFRSSANIRHEHLSVDLFAFCGVLRDGAHPAAIVLCNRLMVSAVRPLSIIYRDCTMDAWWREVWVTLQAEFADIGDASHLTDNSRL